MNDIEDFEGKYLIHYSLVKGIELAKESSKLIDTYILTSGKTKDHQDVNLINVDEITKEFLDKNISIILFIREANIHLIFDKCKSLIEEFINPGRTIKFGIKSDTLGWVNNPDFKQWIKQNHSFSHVTWIYDHFDIMYCQTDMLRNAGKHLFKGDPDNKIRISDMGVPVKIPSKELFENPYDINHSYCVKTVSEMGNCKAFLPLLLCENTNEELLEKFNKQKYILIYTGRIRTDNGSLLNVLKDIMNNLPDNYELHIFPGRFKIPGGKLTDYSAKNSNHLVELRDFFKDNINIIIHRPYDYYDRYKYLHYADVGLDFSSTRPKDIKTKAGNAKLLEYCSFGLPVISESNVINSFLVVDGKNGILLDGIPTPKEYADNIQKLVTMVIDREYAIKVTTGKQNWHNRAIGILNDFEG